MGDRVRGEVTVGVRRGEEVEGEGDERRRSLAVVFRSLVSNARDCRRAVNRVKRTCSS